MNEHNNQRGFMVVLMAAAIMFLMLIFAGLAIDVGRGFVVRTELQTAADAAALAAAKAFFQDPGGSFKWTSNNKEAAEKAVIEFLGKNRADGKVLKDYSMDFGFWNIPGNRWIWSATVSGGVCEENGASCMADSWCPPGGKGHCLQLSAPAVAVTVEKSPGLNDGPMPTVFAKIVGKTDYIVTASAVAMSGNPAGVPQGTLFPFAIVRNIKDCFVNKQPPNGDEIQLDAAYASCPGYSGKVGDWTNLSSGNGGSADTLKDYIDQFSGAQTKSRSPAIDRNAQIKDVTGSKDALYTAAQTLIDGKNPLVLMPVVDRLTPPMTVKSFVGVELTSSTTNCLKGRLVRYYPLRPGPTSYLKGENTSAMPPKLVE